MLQVVIPMAGLGTRFTSYGFKTNKYLLPINIQKQPMIELAITSLNVSVPCKFFFIINEEAGRDENLRTLLANICQTRGYQFEIQSVACLTEGPASTVAILRDSIDMNSPMIVSNSDQVLENWNFERFAQSSATYDGCVLTYQPDYPLVIGATDKNSFVRFDAKTGAVCECREKIVLSNTALVGVHYFASAQTFFAAYDYMVAHNIRAPNGEFYLSLCYQSMLEMGKTVGACNMCIDEKYWPVGEPNDYFQYLYSVGGYKHHIARLGADETHLFANGISYVKYLKTTTATIQNPGLIMLLSGNATTQNGTKLAKYETTNMNIILESECELVLVYCNEYSVDNPQEIYHPSNFTRGWLIGNFRPAIFRTIQFELCIMTHNKNEKWDYHYHEYMGEINVLLEGSMEINNRPIHCGDIFYIQENQLVCPNFVENCKVLCIKTPSVIGDKVCL